MKEQTRDLKVKDYNSVNYNPDKSDRNIILEHDKRLDYFSTYRGFIEDFYIREDLTGRFNLNTNDDRNATKVLSSFVCSGSRDFISSFSSKEEIIDYYKECNNFLKIEYPDYHIVDSRIHWDEDGLPHLHTSGVMLHIKEDGSRSINVTQNQKGKDYFRGFQDRFYNYMKEKYPNKDLQRRDPARDHDKKMNVKEYKEFKDYQRDLKEKINRLKDIEKEVNSRGDDLVSYRNYLSRIDDYCNREGITPYQYEKQVFYAERGSGSFPEPEKYNPERTSEREEKEQLRQIEKER